MAEPSEIAAKRLLDLYQYGQYEKAEALAKLYATKFPEHGLSWKVLGAIYKQAGKIDESIAHYQKSITLSPSDAETHFNLGNTFKQADKFLEAEKSYRNAIAANPNHPKAHNNLGNLLRSLGRPEEAISCYEKAVCLKADYGEAYCNMGVTWQKLGNLIEAQKCYTRAIKLSPRYAGGFFNLGCLQQELGHFKEAKASYIRTLNIESNHAHALNNLGAILHKQELFEEAEKCFLNSTLIAPKHAAAFNNLGNIQRKLGKTEKSEDNLLKAIELDPDQADYHNNLGVLFQDLGRLQEAKASFTRAIALRPNFAEAHRHLSAVKRFHPFDRQFDTMRNLLLDKDITEEQLIHINFGLAKAYEDIEDFSKAYKHYINGNKLLKNALGYNINQDFLIFEQIQSHHKELLRLTPHREPNSKAPIPIFIIGMPRSGTTLTEQILSSHNEVNAGGELIYLEKFGGPLARGLVNTDTDALINVKNKYLEKLAKNSRGSLYVTDKMPQNFLLVGLISAIFPEAKIIHVRRNAAAVSWGNFTQYFPYRGLGYSCEIADILAYYRLYSDLMMYWEKECPKKIYNLNYELLVTNPEAEIRKLIDSIDLPWDPDCLSPQLNKRAIATASNVQARKKIYSGSSEKWKRYKEFLDGALDPLINV